MFLLFRHACFRISVTRPRWASVHSRLRSPPTDHISADQDERRGWRRWRRRRRKQQQPSNAGMVGTAGRLLPQVGRLPANMGHRRPVRLHCRLGQERRLSGTGARPQQARLARQSSAAQAKDPHLHERRTARREHTLGGLGQDRGHRLQQSRTACRRARRGRRQALYPSVTVPLATLIVGTVNFISSNYRGWNECRRRRRRRRRPVFLEAEADRGHLDVLLRPVSARTRGHRHGHCRGQDLGARPRGTHGRWPIRAVAVSQAALRRRAWPRWRSPAP